MVQNRSNQVQLNPEDATAYNNRGNVYADLKDYQKAISDYNEAIRLNPEYADAYYNRGVAYNLQGNSRSALESFRKAAELYQRQGSQEDYQNALARIRELE